MLRLVATVLVAMFMVGCANDNNEIRDNPDDTFRYTDWDHHYRDGTDMVDLHFVNESTGEPMTWNGDVRDAMVYLEQIDKGKCYKNPVTRDRAVEVGCG